MRRITLLLLTLLCISTLFAQNRLIVFSDDGEKFIMFLNGEQQNESPAVNVKSADLNSDSYRVKIAFNNKGIPELNQTVSFLDPNKELTFAIAKNKKGAYVLRFVSETAFVPQSKPAPATENVKEITYETPVETAKPAQTQVVTQVTTTEVNTQTSGTSGNTETVGFNMSVGETGMNVTVNDGSGEAVQFSMDVNIDDTGNPAAVSTTVTTTTTTSTTYNETVTVTDNQVDNYDRRPGGQQQPPQTVSHQAPQPISDSEFAEICSSIKSKSFEDSKLTLAKQVIKSNVMSSAQIAKIMNLFDFESTKLEFAKFAYDFAYDKNNYYKVNDVFDFESSIDDLNEYIESK